MFKKVVQQGPSHFDARIVHGVREHGKMARTPLAAFFNIPIWSNWDMRGWVKLDVLAKALNVETKSGSGAQVAEMWAKGFRKEMADHCLQDNFVTYGGYSRIVFQKPHSREDVLRMPQYIKVD
jgi:hypothetical protein